MKQTAVEWLIEQLPLIQQEGLRDEIEQALQMEWEQKIKFANDYGFHICGYDYENAEEYYNQTYKQQTP